MPGSVRQMTIYQKSAADIIFKHNLNYIDNYINNYLQLLPVTKILFYHVSKKILVLLF